MRPKRSVLIVAACVAWATAALALDPAVPAKFSKGVGQIESVVRRMFGGLEFSIVEAPSDGQVLQAGSGKVIWGTVPAPPAENLADTLAAGNTMTAGQSIASVASTSWVVDAPNGSPSTLTLRCSSTDPTASDGFFLHGEGFTFSSVVNDLSMLYVDSTADVISLGTRDAQNSFTLIGGASDTAELTVLGNFSALCSEYVLTNPAGTGNGRLDSVSTTTVVVHAAFAREYEAFTASDTLTVAESGKLCTNTGAGAPVVLTLPTGAPVGTTYTAVRTEAFALRVKPSAGNRILYSGGLMAIDEYLELAIDGAKIEVVYDGATRWIATLEHPTLNEETP